MADCILYSQEISLKFSTSIVFSKNEIYVCYMSDNLINNIIQKLNNIRSKYNVDDYINNVEQLLEEIEIFYTIPLLPFNKYLSNSEIHQYIQKVKSLGVIINRFTYNDNILV